MLVLAGCAPGTSSGSSGIDGTVLSGPHCPVGRADSPCPDLPVADATVVASDAAGHEVARATSGSDGRFRLPLPPGTYSLTIEGLVGIQSAKPVQVEVPVRGYARATVLVDTGIR
jgi:hypothetical protein